MYFNEKKKAVGMGREDRTSKSSLNRDQSRGPLKSMTLSRFTEFCLEESCNGIERILRVGSGYADMDLASVWTNKSHQVQNTLPIRLCPAL
jgi:hypothetical protein